MTCPRRSLPRLLLAAILLPACSDPARTDGAFDTAAVDPMPGSSTTDATDSTDGESSGETTAADPTGSPGSGIDPDGEVGCDAVDFLFVIDNSGSMADEQQQLVDSVPGFVSAIEERLPAGVGTYHIMVTDSNPWVYGGCEDACAEAAACEAQSNDGSCDCGYPCALRGLCSDIGDYVCGETQPMECEDILGAGITHPRGRDASNETCDFASGKRFIASGEPDLEGSFECAARVGTNSSLGEKPMEAMIQGLTGSGDVAACNEGFPRDDAVLVVVIITDEDDNGPNASDLEGDSTGSPQAWVDALVEAKNGNGDAIIAMALIGAGDAADGICEPLDPATFEGADPAPRFREFTQMWGSHGITGSVCVDSYVEFFESAVETIGSACDEFVPVGVKAGALPGVGPYVRRLITIIEAMGVLGCAHANSGADPSAPADGVRSSRVGAARMYETAEPMVDAGYYADAVRLMRHSVLSLPRKPETDALRHALVMRMGYVQLLAANAGRNSAYARDAAQMLLAYGERHAEIFEDEGAKEREGIYELLYQAETFAERLEGQDPEAAASEAAAIGEATAQRSRVCHRSDPSATSRSSRETWWTDLGMHA